MNLSASTLSEYSRQIRVPIAILVWLTCSFLIADGSWPTTVNIEDRTAAQLQVMAQGGPPSRQATFLLLGVIGCLGIAWRGTRRPRHNGTMVMWGALFLIWSWASLMWTDVPLLTLRKLILLLTVLAPTLWLVSDYPTKIIPQFVVSVTSAGVLLGFIAEIMVSAFHPSAPGYRFAGMVSANHAGIDCALLVLSAVCLRNESHTPSRFWTPLIVLGTAFLLLTRSRTAFIALGVTLAVLWFIQHPHRQLRMMLASGAASVLVLFSLTGANSLTAALKTSVLLGRDDSTVSTLTGRTPLWDVLLEYAATRPVQGFGYSSFWTPNRIDAISRSQGWGVAEAHSTYVDILLGIGWIGLVLFIVVLEISLAKSVRLWHAGRHPGAMFCFAMLVFCVVDGLTESALAVTSMFQFVFVWCVVSIAAHNR